MGDGADKFTSAAPLRPQRQQLLVHTEVIPLSLSLSRSLALAPSFSHSRSKNKFIVFVGPIPVCSDSRFLDENVYE